MHITLWSPRENQDGGLGRHTVPPRTTKSKDNNNLKTKTNQNWQNIEPQGSLTTKEIMKKHSPRPVGGSKTGSQGGGLLLLLPDLEMWQSVGGTGQAVWQLADPMAAHLRTDKPGGTVGEQNRLCNPGPQCGEMKPQTSDWKHLWGLRQQEKLPGSQERSLERPTGA